MDENAKKEEFSYSYIYMLASICGYIVYRSERAEDNYLGIDLHIIDSESSDRTEAPRIYAQLKGTTPKQFHEEEDCFKYDLKARNYNQLIKRSIDPNILILVIVPENIRDWITIHKDKQESLINGCAYWLSLEGKQKTSNTHEVRIKIPKTNILNLTTLQEVMKDSARRRDKYFDVSGEVDT